MARETLEVDSCLIIGAIVAALVNYEVKLNTAIAAGNAINEVAILSFFVILGILAVLVITDVVLGTKYAIPVYFLVLDISWPIVSFLNFTVILCIFMTFNDRIVTACVATKTSFPWTSFSAVFTIFAMLFNFGFWNMLTWPTMFIAWCVFMPVIGYCKALGVENEDTEPLPLSRLAWGV